MHAALQTAAMAVGTVGFVTKYRGSGEHFRSLHAWLGGAVLILYALQYGAGACAYLLGGVSDRTKVRLLPVHVFMGLLTSTLGVLAICMGIVSQQHFEQDGWLPALSVAGLLSCAQLGCAAYVLAGGGGRRVPAGERLLNDGAKHTVYG